MSSATSYRELPISFRYTLSESDTLRLEVREEFFRSDSINFKPLLKSIEESPKVWNLTAGARGLRSIIEDLMRDIMFDIPSNPQIVKCTITRDTALNKSAPKLVLDKNKKKEPLKMRTTKLQKTKNKTA